VKNINKNNITENNNVKKEPCFYCLNEAEYYDVVVDKDSFIVGAVCKKHVTNYLSG
jgi:hypothetical protein